MEVLYQIYKANPGRREDRAKGEYETLRFPAYQPEDAITKKAFRRLICRHPGGPFGNGRPAKSTVLRRQFSEKHTLASCLGSDQNRLQQRADTVPDNLDTDTDQDEGGQLQDDAHGGLPEQGFQALGEAEAQVD